MEKVTQSNDDNECNLGFLTDNWPDRGGSGMMMTMERYASYLTGGLMFRQAAFVPAIRLFW